MRPAVQVELKYLMRDEDRRGNKRLFVRRHGRKIRLREKPGTPEFLAAYAAACDALANPSDGARKTRQSAPHGSFSWVAARYFAGRAFKDLDAKSRQARRSSIEDALREKHKSGNEMGAIPARALNASHVQFLVECKDTPGAAQNRHKHLSAMFGWAVENQMMTTNPARDVRKPKLTSEGFYTWTDADVAKFEERHPIGTKARLALALMLYTGMRRGDVVKIGRPHVKGGNLVFTPSKTAKVRAEASVKPILPELAQIIAASPTGDMTFLVTDYGIPFTAAGFGGRFRKWCDEAGLPQCTAHGLRKAGATRAAEAGASDRQLMALFDWASSAQATIYTRKADKARMTADAIKFLAPHDLPQQKKA